VRRVVLEVLQRGAAEEAKSMSIIIPAVDAADPEEAIVGLEEGRWQALDGAAEDVDVRAAPVKRARGRDVGHEFVAEAVKLGHHDLHALAFEILRMHYVQARSYHTADHLAT
jgi:hypothetical protein